eukprot:scaffold1618_cov397-Prasinococcus_capsulatus_cf.AAC.11
MVHAARTLSNRTDSPARIRSAGTSPRHEEPFPGQGLDMQSVKALPWHGMLSTCTSSDSRLGVKGVRG